MCLSNCAAVVVCVSASSVLKWVVVSAAYVWPSGANADGADMVDVSGVPSSEAAVDTKDTAFTGAAAVCWLYGVNSVGCACGDIDGTWKKD